MDLDMYLYNIVKIAKKIVNHLQGEVRRKWLDFSALPRDIKSSADLNSEKTILTELQKVSSYPILTEETGQIGDIKESEPIRNGIIEKGLHRSKNWTSNEYGQAVISLLEKYRPYLRCCDFNNYKSKFS